MSKRKSRSAPNLPQETLERARQQAAIDRGEILPEPQAEPEPTREEPEKSPAAVTNPYRTVPARQRRVAATVRSADRRARDRLVTGTRSRGAELDAETISELLDNPTIVVTEDELKAEYDFVWADLRNMFLLAAGLVVTLVVLATVLPQ